MSTAIVNLRHRKADVSCCRGTIFGNPFDHNKLGITRDEACDKYEEYFQHRINTDLSFCQRVKALKGLKLGCWCRCDPPCNHPKCGLRCHVQTIKRYLDNYGN